MTDPTAIPDEHRVSPRCVRLAFALIALAGVGYAFLARNVFHGFPYSGDEYSMYLQAELFARGLLHANAPAHAELLRVDHVVIDALVRSKYPPGWSALLSLGLRAGIPWIVGPLTAVATTLLAWWTTRRHFGDTGALVAVVVLAAAPLSAFQAGTFYAHTATTAWLSLAFLAVSLWTSSQRSRWALLTGVALGCTFLTRPSDAIFFGAALLVLRSPRLIALTALGAAPFALVNFAYQSAQFGSPFSDGYRAYDPTHRAIYGDSAGGSAISIHNFLSPEEQFHHLDVVRALAVDWTVPGAVVVALLGAYAVGATHPARPMRNFSVAIIGVFVGALMTMAADPDDGARPRYLSTTLLPLAFLAAAGWPTARDTLSRLLSSRMALVVAGAAVVAATLQTWTNCADRLPMQHEREGLYRTVRDLGIREGVVVVRAKYPTRYARNGAFFDRAVLYASAPESMSVEAVARAFPGRRVYVAKEGNPWVIEDETPP